MTNYHSNHLFNCKLIGLPKISDPRGNLTFIEGDHHIPFQINRVYYLYDVPFDSHRGGHAHRELHQLIVPLSGGFNVLLDDGVNTKTFKLSSPSSGLYICPLIWRELHSFTSGAVVLVLASDLYLESDYIRDYKDFKKHVNHHDRTIS
jgi:hypothetical protein